MEFDEDDAAVYGPNERGQTEDLEYNELMDAFELCEEWKEDADHEKQINFLKQILKSKMCNVILKYCETNIDLP